VRLGIAVPEQPNLLRHTYQPSASPSSADSL
jgi:hypothetical protein